MTPGRRRGENPGKQDTGRMNRDKIAGIFLFGLGLAVCLKSLTYPLGTLRKPGGGFFPSLASILLMGLAGLLTLQAFRGGEADKASRAPFFPEKESPRRILLAFAALLAYRYLLPLIGFAPSTAVFIFLLSRFLGRYGWAMSALFAVITAAVSYFLFEVWLKIPMPRPYFGM
jgi:putative tricarboxylic transport membrane protein